MIKKITTLILLFAFVFYSFPIDLLAQDYEGSIHEVLKCTNVNSGGDWRLSSGSKWYEPIPFGASSKNPDESSMKYTAFTLERTGSNMGFNKCNDWGDFYEQDNIYKEFNLTYRVKKVSDTKVNFIVETRYLTSTEITLNMDGMSTMVDNLIEISTSSESFSHDLNSQILRTSDSVCTSGDDKGPFKTKVWVNCTTYGLSADGRVGTAIYHQEDKSWGGWLVTPLAIVTGFVTGGFLGGWISMILPSAGAGYASSLLADAIAEAAKNPEILGTVEESLKDTIDGNGKLGVGKWEWTEKFTTSPTSEPVEDPIIELEPILDFRGPETVSPSKDIKLSWITENVDSCEASGNWLGIKQTGGLPYKTENIEQTGLDNYTFILSCDGPNGSISKTVNTKVVKTLRCSFSANPISIISPQESTLSWSCSNADFCSIDQRIGEVNNISDSIKVSPTSTTVYKLFCQGEGDSKEYKATVNVGFIPIIKEVAPY